MKYSVRSLIALLISVVLLASLPVWSGRAQTSPGNQDPAIQSKFSTGSAPELQHAADLTRQYLMNHKEAFGLDRKNDSSLLRSWVDQTSMAHVRVQQTFDNVPVFGGELIVHWKSDGTLFNVTNAWVNNLQLDVVPALTADAASELTTAQLGCPDCLTSRPKVRLWVQRHKGVDRLVYEVRLPQIDEPRGPSMPIYFVDAHSGEIVWSYDNLQTASGSSLYSGEVSFNSFLWRNNYYLEDVTRRIGTYSFRNATSTTFDITDSDDFWTNATAVDAHYGMSVVMDYFRNVHRRNGLDGDGGPYAKASHDGITPLFAGSINYGHNYANAFWNGNMLVFGDGDGSLSSPLVTIDIIGHEMTHALTESTAGLIYSGETGALSESISDVFGAMAERTAKGESDNTWAIAEECWTPGTLGDALRFMDDPHKASSREFESDPDHYSERYRGTSDNGGVHVNVGIPNKAFYLLAKGGTHHITGGSITGIGADDAAKIWYKALTEYMTSTTDFAGARVATESAATVLFGIDSPQLSAVKRAWCLVGVGTCSVPDQNPTQLQNGIPVSDLSGSSVSQRYFYLAVPSGATNLSFQTTGGTGDADLYVKFGSQPTLASYDCRPYRIGNTETCTFSSPAAGDWHVMINAYTPYSNLTLKGSYAPTTNNVELIVNGGFEGSASPWLLAGSATYASDLRAHGGVGYLRLGQTNNSAGVAYQQFTIPPIALSANLTFYLNVTSRETRNEVHDQLFVEVRSSSNRLLQTVATYSNLNAGVAGSWSRMGSFNLSAYRGQTVRLVFRATTDTLLPTTFRIDDVSVR